MNRNELSPKAKEMFENHKTEKVFHGTSDGHFFTEKHLDSANTHANTLKDKSVERFDRSEFEEVVAPDANGSDEGKKAEKEVKTKKK